MLHQPTPTPTHPTVLCSMVMVVVTPSLLLAQLLTGFITMLFFMLSG